MDAALDEGQPPSLLQGVAGSGEAHLEACLLAKRASPWGTQGAWPTQTKADGRDVYYDSGPLDYPKIMLVANKNKPLARWTILSQILLLHVDVSCQVPPLQKSGFSPFALPVLTCRTLQHTLYSLSFSFYSLLL